MFLQILLNSHVILTYFKNTCTSLCFCGLIVASKSGTKIFSNILPKFAIIFLDLKMSLKDKYGTLHYYIIFRLYSIYSPVSDGPSLCDVKLHAKLPPSSYQDPHWWTLQSQPHTYVIYICHIYIYIYIIP